MFLPAEEKRVALKKDINKLNDEMRSSEERRSTDLQGFIKKSDQEKQNLQKRLDDKESKMNSKYK